MKRQNARLPADSKHGFGGSEIDRSKPLTFRLNGLSYEAFAGDTVLSAVLAAGVDSAGRHNADAIALESACAPALAHARRAKGAVPMPMDMVPASAGLDLVTLGPRLNPLPQRGLVARLASLVADRRSLAHRLDDPRSVDGRGSGPSEAEVLACETLVIGGGITGMAAALAAAKAGARVILVERRPTLGGDARFFGTVGEEASPESTITRLSEKLAETPDVTVLTRTEGLVLAGTRLRARQVTLDGGQPAGRFLAISADRVVLATGATERLPVFPGNRAPGVVSTVEAFHRAERYGVWSGRRALFATPNNYGYRLALLAADAGVEVQRVVDSRIGPQSRFIDFCKASGITLASGLVPQSADPVKGADLRVNFAVAVEEAGSDAGAVTTELLVVAGGWQPRLNLWLMAGGAAVYDFGRRWLAADGELDGIVLAGSAAGWRSSTACLASAEAALDKLLGRKPKEVSEYEVDAIYESAEAPAPVAPWRPGRGAYLDRGLSFTTRPAPARNGGNAVQPAEIGLLSLGDVASFVQLGAIPDRDAGVIAQERCLAPEEITDSGWRPRGSRPPAAAPDTVPAYLAGRYGPKPQLAVLAAADGRRLEVGCLLYPGSDTTDPGTAIGVIMADAPPGKAGALALTSRAGLAAAPMLFVRDTSGPVAVSVTDKL